MQKRMPCATLFKILDEVGGDTQINDGLTKGRCKNCLKAHAFPYLPSSEKGSASCMCLTFPRSDGSLFSVSRSQQVRAAAR